MKVMRAFVIASSLALLFVLAVIALTASPR